MQFILPRLQQLRDSVFCRKRQRSVEEPRLQKHLKNSRSSRKFGRTHVREEFTQASRAKHDEAPRVLDAYTLFRQVVSPEDEESVDVLQTKVAAIQRALELLNHSIARHEPALHDPKNTRTESAINGLHCLEPYPAWKEQVQVLNGLPLFLARHSADAFSLQQLLEINQALANTSSSVYCTVKQQAVTYYDISKLREGEWLNDQLINSYLALVEPRPGYHVFNTYFFEIVHRMHQQGNWNSTKVKRMLSRQDLAHVTDKEYLVFPINLKSVHWLCVVVATQQQRILYIDSMGRSGFDSVVEVLNGLLRLCGEPQYAGEVMECPQQENANDCGMFMLKAIHSFVRDKPFSYSQEDMKYYRKTMVLELKANKLIEP